MIFFFFWSCETNRFVYVMMMQHHTKNKKCFVCNQPTLGIFNAAQEIKKRMAEERKKAQGL